MTNIRANVAKLAYIIMSKNGRFDNILSSQPRADTHDDG